MGSCACLRAGGCAIDVVDLDNDLQTDPSRAGEAIRTEVMIRRQGGVVLDADRHGARVHGYVSVSRPTGWRAESERRAVERHRGADVVDEELEP